ncbi:transcriptional regulator FlhC [Halioglobus japonicus]|uniref:Flagellar transcriptional regulator FlhC n=1 Tax=Halioglobus japonicus TaxID=930805 RepID=A0AAP8SMZ9_9GAMM|nr:MULTISPECIES: flagellar transcriptional regulator FlhC [Halioglobus]AQA18109.1 transcriptional regulator FlhC [Halioglobus japonicus]KZX54893.1 transcriptional regulator FlhC [Halioglobus sp. HI00S01]PLW86102.1 flagellar transcriptional regulator FlhC [Halioglobus japonicus]GHD14465.1 flagellar transcriptional regulator FlhC [Halioglobus japonicus]
MTTRNIVEESRQVQLCIDLIELGARLQVLEVETDLSRGRLLKLYKEVRGESPPRGMLPYSIDWFLTWMPNIHSSLFYNIYRALSQGPGSERINNFIGAYSLYKEQLLLDEMEPVLTLTRAWTLLRFCESGVLDTCCCEKCGVDFVRHPQDLHTGFVCGICQPPSRAGKTLDRS